MSFDNFLSYLQQLLTMVSPENQHSIALAKTALSNTIMLAHESGKVDSMTFRSMKRAEQLFNFLVNHADDFKGVPGDFTGNKHKRTRLAHIIQPGC